MEYVTTLADAINIMGRNNVVTIEDVNKLALHVNSKPLKIPLELLKWDKEKTVLRRKRIIGKEFMQYLINYNVREIYYAKEDYVDVTPSTLTFPKKKSRWHFWQKRWLKKHKLDAWHMFSQGDYKPVWVAYEEKLEDSCPYVLIPGVNINIYDMFYKFDGMICHKNDPLNKECRCDAEEMVKNGKESITRKVPDGWYLVLKNPERDRFINKDRETQQSFLKNYEVWGKAAEAVLAILLTKTVHDVNILTDYVHTNDYVYKGEGPFTVMIRNMVAYEDVNRGNVTISHNSSFHSHRNTVLFVMANVTGE